MQRLTSRRFAVICLVAIAAASAGRGRAATVLFAENFNGVQLTSAPTYGVPGVYSPVPPPGWEIATVVPPGGVP